MSGAAIVGLLMSLAIPAQADEAKNDPLSVLEDVTAGSSSAATEVLSDVAGIPTDESGSSAVDAIVNEVRVLIPTDPVDPVSLESSTGATVKITLPFSNDASTAEAVKPGVVAYDNDNGSTTVPVVKDDGSVQIATVINDSAAPTTYEYNLGLTAGSSLALQSDGMVSILGPDGSPIGAFAPAWAKDANGAEVATHYEVNGTTLVQVVEHAVAGIAYPVTADPYLGWNLISSGRWVGGTLQITPTSWGRANGNNPTAVNNLYYEYCNRFRSSCNTQMWWQLGCHAQFAPFKSTWNLDSWRWRASYWDYVRNGCN